jgi:hypothetical protein
MERQNLYPLIFNNDNLVSSTYNNVYKYSFPQGSIQFKKSKVAVASVSMYYSTFNITAANNNNTFTIEFPVFGTLAITVPDGFYSVSALNSFIQQTLIANDLYLIDAAGDFVYHIELVENPTLYSIQQNSYAVPTALPAGFTQPAGWPGYPGVAETPQLVVSSNDFTNLIGFDSGTYPAVVQATTFSKTSDFTPQISPVQSMILTCNLVQNQLANPQTVLYAFSSGDTSFGSLIDSSPNQFSFVNVQDGNYNSIQIEFLDQSFNKLVIQDTNLVVQLLITTED